MTWLWMLWISSFTSLARADEGTDPCRRFRTSVDPATGVLTRSASAPVWSMKQQGASTTFSVLLHRAGHHAEPLAHGDRVCLHLANGEDVELPVIHSATPTHTHTKYEGVTWWRAEVSVPQALAARIAATELVNVEAQNQARIAGRGPAQRRKLAEAFACVATPTR